MAYHSNDENGKVHLGWISEAIEFPLVAFTGNPADKLSFVASTSIFETPHINIEYPASFGRKWESDHSGVLNFETTATAFGLSDAPTTGITHCHQEGEVVGWGTLKLPNSNGGAPNEVEAILVKTVETCVDSFFLFGQPAPPTFLGAFGIVQGRSSTRTNYSFYIKGLKSEVLSIERRQNEGSEAFSSNVSISAEVDLDSGITLTSADCTLSPSDTVIMKPILNPATVADPTEGLDQYWDYSNITVDPGAETHTDTYAPVTANAVFPTATASSPSSIATLPGLAVPRLNYHRNDENGKVHLGWITEAIEFPLEVFTGNPADKLSFVETITILETPHINIEYPTSFGRKWESDHNGVLNWETTAAAFGLSDVPTSGISYCHQEGEVVGWGTLKLPNAKGGAPNEVEALLVKTVEICIDSFFLFGQPAPPTFLGAFGIVQGVSRTHTDYSFYIKGLKSEVLSIGRTQNEGAEAVSSVAFISSEIDLDNGITLERPDFIAEAGLSIFSRQLDTNSVGLPTEGGNQIWDYTALQTSISDTLTLLPSNDATFPDADIVTQSQVSQGAGNVSAIFDRSDYFVLNDNTYGQVGIKFGPAGIPLEGITGSATDSLNAIGTAGFYPNGPDYLAWFPMNYGDDIRSSNYVIDNQFLLTAAAFGLNQVPTADKVIGNTSHEVAGWGALSLTNPTDQSTVTLDALLMKTTRVEADSFFLGGAPMQEPFLSAFGVTQGHADTSITYRFYAKGYPDAVLTLHGDSGNILAGWDFLMTTSTKEEAIAYAIPFKYYPNPATNQLNLAFEKSTNEPWIFSLYNTMGQKVFDHLIAQPKGTINEPIAFRQAFPTGHYFYLLNDGNQRIMSSGKLQIN